MPEQERWAIEGIGEVPIGEPLCKRLDKPFRVYELDAGAAGRFALKVVGPDSRAPGVMVAARNYGGISTVFDVIHEGGRRLVDANRDAMTTELKADLLRDEAATLERVGAEWNRGLVQLSTQTLRDEPTVGLVTSWLDGPTLASLPRARRRELFPRILPALWEACGRARHGDLKPEHIVIIDDGRRFALLDPGAQVLLVERYEDQATIGFDAIRFVTTLNYYPVLPPYYAGSTDKGDLDAHFLAYVGGMTRNGQRPRKSVQVFAAPSGPFAPPQPRHGIPLAADLQAMAAIYYEILTDQLPLVDSRRWPWIGLRAVDDDVELPYDYVGGVPPLTPPRTIDPEITEVEERLAIALWRLEVHDRATLVELVREVIAGVR